MTLTAMSLLPVHALPTDERSSSLTNACAALLVAGAVSFNFLLAALNAKTGSVASFEVIACEAAILACSLSIIVMCFRTGAVPWFALMWIMICIAGARFFWTGNLDPKALRDVLIIPIFLALGQVAGRPAVDRLFLWLHIAVTGIALVELLAPDAYTALVNTKLYYMNTRGFSDASFWNQSSDLFVSATRPTERAFFPSLGQYRASSIFLEPVSLGNYCTIITAYLCARFSELPRRVIVFFIAANLFLLVASDGRLAISTSIIIIGISCIAARLRYLSVLYLPGVILASLAVHGATGLVAEDNLIGRVGHSAGQLLDMPLAGYMGVLKDNVVKYMDSGFAYLIITQSVFGLCVIWAFLSVFLHERTREQIRIKHATLLYLALTMTVSYSFITIKTAALAWFLVGAIQSVAPSRERSFVPPRLLAG